VLLTHQTQEHTTTIAPPSDSELGGFLGHAGPDFEAAATVAMVLVGSTETARSATDEANASFEVASAVETPAGPHDLVTTFDCLHDMGDPVAAASRIRQVTEEDGTWLLVEPFAGEALEDDRTPSGGSSTASRPRAAARTACPRGATTAWARRRISAGWRRWRMTRASPVSGSAAQTPFNLIIEVRP
jgi:hypothetical protein